jgi:hypothetical protein
MEERRRSHIIDEVLKMTIKSETKKQAKTVPLLETPVNNDLTDRLQRISEQTGLSSHDLFQKWILQEESLIGLIQNSGGQTSQEPEASPASRQEEPAVQKKGAKANAHSGASYRKVLLRRMQKLKKEGMTLKKIAEIFNDENLPTLSGKGKWHASSVIRL